MGLARRIDPQENYVCGNPYSRAPYRLSFGGPRQAWVAAKQRAGPLARPWHREWLHRAPAWGVRRLCRKLVQVPLIRGLSPHTGRGKVF
jgi:hypothetical protein